MRQNRLIQYAPHILIDEERKMKTFVKGLKPKLQHALLTGEKAKENHITGPSWKNAQIHNGLPMVGRVISTKSYFKSFLGTKINRFIQLVKGLDISVLEDSLFFLPFNRQSDLKIAFDGYPWVLDKHALVLNKIPFAMDPNFVNLDWFFESHPIKIKIKIDMTKCIQWGINICTPEGQMPLISLTYEHLPTLYFLSEILGHLERCYPL
ncbi:hypothetical protein CDL12_25965 [Handroanthus impetiginosus]|uniref:DUF4283 domain-containing protein n=1 Tax=Handroanthus impetiginosus TaxID=429701 RepID=A0A2G9G8B1_9LAMI|nr:hypothetical protein CDL12_25965 [Handroanthus impetiginosus]